jgi:PAS domain S-box-containing protein
MKRVLIADDIAENLYLLETLLKGNGFEVIAAENGAKALELARTTQPDLIISDILMPVMDGYSLCKEWRADPQLRQIPFIFYTATYTEKKDEELALGLGADRFLIKPMEPDVLMAVVREVLAQAGPGYEPPAAFLAEDETLMLKGYSEVLFRKLEHKMAALEATNLALQESREDFRQFIMKCPLPIAISNGNGTVELLNDRYTQVLGYTLEDIPHVDVWWERAYPDPAYRGKVASLWNAAKEKAILEGSDIHAENGYQVTCKDGTVRTMEICAAPISNRQMVIFNDLTEQKKLETQYLHAQKMESIGTMAGGVAHDFNNILTAIMGFGQLALKNAEEGTPLRRHIKGILEAADRGANLTRELLLFSRKQKGALETTDLNNLLTKTEQFLLHILGEDISLELLPCGSPLLVLADSNQLEQVLMNLAVNARDAMPQGGKLILKAEQAVLDKEFIAAHGFGKPGEYALLTASDTGTGMDRETMQRIFEPFFTTKDVGKGTGLGLSVVYGIVKDHNGCVTVESEPGQGATFSIYLPLTETVPKEIPITDKQLFAGGTETILLAEDNDLVRQLVTTLLSAAGYTIIEAVDGEEAVKKFKENADSIQLLLFDLIMPKMNGKEAADAIQRLNPGIKIIFTSGYSPEIAQMKASLVNGFHLIQKPVSPQELMKKVRGVLDGAP